MSQGLDSDGLYFWQDSWKVTIFLLCASKYVPIFCWVDRKPVSSAEGQQPQVWGSGLNFLLWLSLFWPYAWETVNRGCRILELFLRSVEVKGLKPPSNLGEAGSLGRKPSVDPLRMKMGHRVPVSWAETAGWLSCAALCLTTQRGSASS